METSPRPPASPADRLCTVWPLDPAAPPDTAQEVVHLITCRRLGAWVSTATRSWVSDLAGTGLEADLMDPVEILAGTRPATVEGFHATALAVLAERRSIDYEVADLFAIDP